MKTHAKSAGIILAGAAAMTVLLSGCGTGGKADGKTVVEIVQYKPEAVKAFDALEEKFNETHDDIELVISSPNDAMTILKTRFIREDYPDIIGIGGDINYSNFLDADMLMDVSDYGGLVIGYIFSFIFTYVLPTVAQRVGIEALSSSMLSSTGKAWIAIVIVGCWQAIAMNTIIYISGLQTVPEDVYEAGSLDGVTGWKKFRYLTFPLIIPFFSINMVLCMKNFLMVFDQIMALTKGGPSQSTESISYLIYNNGMSGGQFGFQSANAFVFFIVIVAISVFQMTVTNRKEEQL